MRIFCISAVILMLSSCTTESLTTTTEREIMRDSTQEDDNETGDMPIPIDEEDKMNTSVQS